MVVAVSSTANARRGAPARPPLTAGENQPSHARVRATGPALDTLPPRGGAARVRAPKPWASPLARPAAKILVAGGLTLAGWLLTGALSGHTASAAETAACEHSSVSTVEHGRSAFGHHHRASSHRETGAARCTQATADSTAAEDSATSDATETTTGDTATSETPASDAQPAEPATGETTPADTATTEPATSEPASTPTEATQPATTEPATSTETQPSIEEPTKTTTTSGGGLLGGLVGGVLNVVGGTLNTVTSTVGVVTDTLSHTVLAPLTQPPASNPDAPVLLPIDDILNPILGGSSSGSVTVTVPATTATPETVTVEIAPAATAETTTTPQTPRFALVRLAPKPQAPVVKQQDTPRDSGVHARDGGGDSTPGLPGGTTAPSAPATTATSGHDGPGGARHPFAVHTDDVTTTQLKLIGASRDHDVDGAGREAALPTTSPD